ncbi:hypothetical protein evm_014373, partial [Chilo suppressalis]
MKLGRPPTTFANDVILSLGREEIIDEELLLPPPLPTAGTSRQDTSAAAGTVPPPSNSATNASHRRSGLLLSGRVDAEIDRMACIEERRVEAKRLIPRPLLMPAEVLTDSQMLPIAEAHTRAANALGVINDVKSEKNLDDDDDDDMPLVHRIKPRQVKKRKDVPSSPLKKVMVLKKPPLPMSKVQQLICERDPTYLIETNILTI